MNYLIVSYYYPPRNGPGGERVAHMADTLAKWGHSVDVLTKKWNGSREWKQHRDVNVIFVDSEIASHTPKNQFQHLSTLKKNFRGSLMEDF